MWQFGVVRGGCSQSGSGSWRFEWSRRRVSGLCRRFSGSGLWFVARRRRGADGRLQCGQVATVDPALGKSSRKHLKEARPLLGAARFHGNRDPNRTSHSLLHLNGASDDANLGLLVAIGPARLPGSMATRRRAPQRDSAAWRHLNGPATPPAFDRLTRTAGEVACGVPRSCAVVGHGSHLDSCQRIYAARMHEVCGTSA